MESASPASRFRSAKKSRGWPAKKLNPSYLEDLAKRIRKELNVRAVTPQILRGDTPDYVKVIFEIKGRPRSFDVSVPKFLYHTKQGWSAAVEGTFEVWDQRFTGAIVSDGDALAERFAGVYARYENPHLGTDRVRFALLGETYHEQWNRATRTAGAETYRARHNIEPSLTFQVAGPLTLSVGASFARIEPEFPAASTLAANAAVTSLRYHRSFEGANGLQQQLDAGYNLRAATNVLSSDYIYARHNAQVRYTLGRGRHVIFDDAMAGIISGHAPLYERYVLGTSSTLRGWNKFDIDPLGGDRMAHNTLEYRYRVFEVFYDVGAVWSRGQPAEARHALGAGLRRGGFSLAVAFPVRENRVEPVFMVGMNY
jgi:Outer membrane protein/protective antigen OMA87